MDILPVLSKIPLFKPLPAQDLSALAGLAVLRAYPKGACIFSQGETPSGLHVVVSGRVRVYKSSVEGKEQTLHVFEAPQLVGEAAVFANEPYPAHAETMEPARLLVFPRRDFMALIESQPGFAGRLLAIMARRLLHFTLLVEDLSLKEVPNRLAAYLLARQDREGLVTLDMNKRQLASVLGATPETLSRVLANFAREELVLLSSSKSIRLRDPERLRILAEAGNRKSES